MSPILVKESACFVAKFWVYVEAKNIITNIIVIVFPKPDINCVLTISIKII